MGLKGLAYLYFDPITDLCVGAQEVQTGEQYWLPGTSGKNHDGGEYFFPEPVYPLGMTADKLKSYAVKQVKQVKEAK